MTQLSLFVKNENCMSCYLSDCDRMVYEQKDKQIQSFQTIFISDLNSSQLLVFVKQEIDKKLSDLHDLMIE